MSYNADARRSFPGMFPAARLVSGLMLGLLLVSLASCHNSGKEQVASGAGSISFSVQWQAAPNRAASVSAASLAPLDCTASGVATVAAAVYDAGNNQTASGGPWDCAAHAGSIRSVPPGFSLKVLILGKDANGTVLYRGEQAGVSVIEGRRASAGTIVASLFAPTLSSPEDGASVLNAGLRFEWSGVGDSYHIQVAATNAFDTPIIDATVLSSSFTPTAPPAAGTYFWRVKSIDPYGNESAWSGARSFTATIPEPPPAPILTSPVSGATVTNGGFTFSWSGSGTSYHIQVAADQAFSSPVIDDTSAALSYIQKIVLPPGTYYWRVQASNIYAGAGAWSAPANFIIAVPSTAVCVLPTAPAQVNAAPGVSRTILTWTTVPDALSYNIYWSTLAGAAANGTPVVNASSPYTHTGLANGTTYYYVVKAVNICGPGVASSESSATPQLIAPAPISPLNGSPASSGGLFLAWSDLGSTYHLQVSNVPTFATTNIDAADLAAAIYYPASPLADGTYYWRVQATDAFGNASPWSATWSFSITQCQIPVPARPSITAGDGFVRIAWGTPLGAISNIYWSTSPDVSPATGTKIAGATPIYQHGPLVNGVTYYYVLTAVNSCGEGPPLPATPMSATPCAGCIPTF